MKGVAYLGALQALQDEKRIIDLKNVKRVGGTSAGAMIAGLLGVGYTIEELEDILRNKILLNCSMVIKSI